MQSNQKSLPSNKNKSDKITPLVKSLSEVVSIDENTNWKEELYDYLLEKYSQVNMLA